MPRVGRAREATSLLLLALTACGGGKDTPKAREGCDLSGTYRTRFDAGVGQWLWFRFEVDSAMKATMRAPSAVDEKTTTLTVDPDPAACKLSVVAKTDRGEILASLTLDPKTQKVTGTLRMVGAREGVALDGVRDPVGGTPPRHACIKPGRYQLVVPAEQEWKAEDGGSCDNAIIKVPFLVEELGDKLSIDQLDDDGSAAWTAEDYGLVGDCEVVLRFRNREYTAQTRLTFGGDQVTAALISASIQVLDKGDSRRCRVTGSPMAWVEKLEAGSPSSQGGT